MTIPDLLLLLLVLACIAYFFAKKRRKKISNAVDSDTLQVGTLKGSGCNPELQPLNYLSLRQSEATALHGVSVYSFKSPDDDIFLDTDMETSLSNAVTALVKDGFKPHVNAVSSGSSLVFYITY